MKWRECQGTATMTLLGPLDFSGHIEADGVQFYWSNVDARADGYRVERYFPVLTEHYPADSWQEIAKISALDSPSVFVPGSPPGRYRIHAFGEFGWGPWIEITV